MPGLSCTTVHCEGVLQPGPSSIAAPYVFNRQTYHGLVLPASTTGAEKRLYSSYFAQKMPGEATGDKVYIKLYAGSVSTELTNNNYISRFSENNEKAGKVYWSDIVVDKE